MTWTICWNHWITNHVSSFCYMNTLDIHHSLASQSYYGFRTSWGNIIFFVQMISSQNLNCVIDICQLILYFISNSKPWSSFAGPSLDNIHVHRMENGCSWCCLSAWTASTQEKRASKITSQNNYLTHLIEQNKMSTLTVFSEKKKLCTIFTHRLSQSSWIINITHT